MNENLKDEQPAGRDKEQAGDTKQSDMTPTKSRRVLFGILFIATLAAVGGGLYLADRNRAAGLSTRATVEELLASREMLSARIKELEMQLDQLHGQQEVTSRSIQDLVRELPGGNEDWALREVEFLLIIATHHLELERNLDAALGAMQEADLRLRGLDGAALDPVRVQLAGDIKRLQEMNTVDTKGLALFLGDLAGHVNSLPLADAAGAAKGTGKNTDILLAPPAEHEGIPNTLWRELRGLVVIRHKEEKRRALLAPDQEYFVYQNLRLELESARLSLLRRDTENLHASVATLQQWLAEYFDTNEPAVVKVMASLQQLSSINLDPALPDISSSLESLRAYMRDKAEAPPPDAEDKAPHL